jgi:hypothetical protein
MIALWLVYFVVFLCQPCQVSVKAATSSGIVQLYTDGSCSQPTGDNINIGIESCLNTNGSFGITGRSFPSCADNISPILYISDLDDCRKPDIWPSVSSGEVGDCLSFVTGSSIGSAAFVCVKSVTTVSPRPNPTTTMQIQASQSDIQSAQNAASTSSNTKDPQSSATQSPGVPTIQSQHGSDESDGLSQTDRITIALGVSFGLATLIVGLVALWMGWLSLFYTKLGCFFQSMLMPERMQRNARYGNFGPPPPYSGVG